MPKETRSLNVLKQSDTTLLMCALLLGGADREVKSFLWYPVKISSFQSVDEAVRKAYRDLSCSRPENRTTPFKISRT